MTIMLAAGGARVCQVNLGMTLVDVLYGFAVRREWMLVDISSTLQVMSR